MKALGVFAAVLLVIALVAGGIYYYASQEEKMLIRQNSSPETLAKVEKAEAAAATDSQPATPDSPVADSQPARPEPAATKTVIPTKPGQSTAAARMPASTARFPTTMKVAQSKKTNPKLAIEGPNKATGYLRDSLPVKKVIKTYNEQDAALQNETNR